MIETIPFPPKMKVNVQYLLTSDTHDYLCKRRFRPPSIAASRMGPNKDMLGRVTISHSDTKRNALITRIISRQGSDKWQGDKLAPCFGTFSFGPTDSEERSLEL